MSLNYAYSDFLADVKDFASLAESLNDDWTIMRHSEEPPGTYLVQKRKINVPATETAGHEDSADEDLEEPDPSCRPAAPDDAATLCFEHHVLYSLSYGVPQLFFRVARTSGRALRLDEFEALFLRRLGASPASGQLDLGAVLTQMEHPLLFRPFFALHPCRTAEVLAARGASRNRLLTFLSVYGPPAFLDLDLRYGVDVAAR